MKTRSHGSKATQRLLDLIEIGEMLLRRHEVTRVSYGLEIHKGTRAAVEKSWTRLLKFARRLGLKFRLVRTGSFTPWALLAKQPSDWVRVPGAALDAEDRVVDEIVENSRGYLIAPDRGRDLCPCNGRVHKVGLCSMHYTRLSRAVKRRRSS